jgi:hypothetical protein
VELFVPNTIRQFAPVKFTHSSSPYVLVATFIIISVAYPLAGAVLRPLGVRGFVVPLPVPVRFPFIDPASAGSLRVIKPNHTASITFSVTPNPPFKLWAKNVTQLAFSNWLGVCPDSQILVFESPGRFRDLPDWIRNRTIFGPQLETDEMGLPYVDDFIHKSFGLAKTDLLCVIDFDVFLPEDFIQSLSFLNEFYSQSRTQFGALGRRCLIEIPPSNASLAALADDFQAKPSLESISFVNNAAYSNDFIVISTNAQDIDLDDIPPFHLGTYHWDTWIAGWLAAQMPVVALPGRCGSFHLMHGRGSVPLWKITDNSELVDRRGRLATFASALELQVDGRRLMNGTDVLALFVRP